MTDGATPFDYESGIWGEETIRPSDRSIAGFRLRRALEDIPERGRVLEVGCGAGRFLRGVARARPGVSVTGMDVSRAALRRAGEISPGLDLRLIADANAPLPAAAGEFDTVLALDVLEHLADPARMLAEIHHVLAPGGVLHLHVPCEGDGLSLWRWLPGGRGPGGLKARYGGHVQWFRRADIPVLLASAGFGVERVRYSLHLAGNLADVGVFVVIALAHRLRRKEPPMTTGRITAGAEASRNGGAASPVFGLVRVVDALLWAEASLLQRIPSWSLHVSARRRDLPPGG